MLRASVRRGGLVLASNANRTWNQASVSALAAHALPLGRDTEEEQKRRSVSLQTQIRSIHSAAKNQSVVLVCLGAAGAAFGASIALDAIAKRRAEKAAAAAAEGADGAEAKKEGNMFNSLFGSFLGAKQFYHGGFEEKMTKREAALILGVRESASRERIREAHRYMSRVNHPDQGGSEFLAMKINEAKDMLLGSK